MKYTAKFFIRWASLLGLLLSGFAGAQTVHISHCMAGCPVGNSDGAVDDAELIVRQLFVASISEQNGLPDWQAYRVLADSVGVASLLPRAWFEDTLVRGDTGLAEAAADEPQFLQSLSSDAEERSYQLNEIELPSEDRGRLVPMSSFAGTPYWEELNYLSNMAALPYALRVGSWSRLDQAINALAATAGRVYVVSGPVYADSEPGEREDGVEPRAYFKVISTPDALAAFIFERDIQQHVSYCDQISTLQAVEAETGLRLYPQREAEFPASLQESLGCDS